MKIHEDSAPCPLPGDGPGVPAKNKKREGGDQTSDWPGVPRWGSAKTQTQKNQRRDVKRKSVF